MMNALKIIGILVGAYLIADAGVILGVGFTTDIYEGRIVLDENTKLGKACIDSFEASNWLYNKVFD